MRTLILILLRRQVFIDLQEKMIRNVAFQSPFASLELGLCFFDSEKRLRPNERQYANLGKQVFRF